MFFISSFIFIFFDPDTEGFIRTRSIGGWVGAEKPRLLVRRL